MSTIQQPTQAPQWLIDACGPVDTRQQTPRHHIATNVDQDSAFKRGEYYVSHEAPDALLGGRNDTAYKVAAYLRDLGLDLPNTQTLLDEWSNSKCEPPMDPEEVDHVANSVFHYGRNAPGAAAPETHFEPIAESHNTNGDNPDNTPNLDPKPARPPLVLTPVQDVPPADIPPRQWLVGHFLLQDKVTELIAPPGAGKSTFALQVAMSVITGGDYTGMPVKKQGPVLVINNEDDSDEMNRRLQAVMQFHNVEFDSIRGKLWLYSGVERPFLIAKRTLDGTIKAVDKTEILTFIQANGIKLLVVDPFLETHTASENSNEEVNQVARLYREIAVKANCAVLIVHHTRKLPSGSADGHTGNMESGRGASSLAGVARVISTLYSMSKKDAKLYGVDENQRHRYVRLDDAKANLSLVTHQAKWYRKESVQLANGDEVGVLSFDNSLVPVEETALYAALEAVSQCVATFDGEVPLHRAAKFAAEALGDDTRSLDTLKRQIREALVKRQSIEGWVIWYAEDDRPATKEHGRTKHWIFGHIDKQLDEEGDD